MGRIRRLTIYSDKIKTSKKIIVYSDLHLGFKDRSNIKEVFNTPELAPANYDCILIPGDIVHIGKKLENQYIKTSVIDELAQLTGTTPTYISLGNHDQYARNGFENWAAYCEHSAIAAFSTLPNVHLLDINEKVLFDDIELSAINNSVYYYLDYREDKDFFTKEYNLRQNKMSFSEKAYSILLTHDPKSIYRLSIDQNSCFVPNTDLVISGHMHNGLVPNHLQPFFNGRGLLSPDYTLFPSVAYGIKEVNETIFLINGAISSFVEIPLINKLYGVNCTVLELHPNEPGKKLTYTYK